MRILYQIPTWIRAFYRGVIWRMDSSSKVVYFTFDDGPIPEVTPSLLQLLKQKGVHATFFMVADNARRYPELLEQVRREGHSVGNHTLNHWKGTRYSTRDYMSNVAMADSVLGGTRAFRPPYGKMKFSQKRALLKQGYRIYLWDVLTHDYNKSYSPEKMLRIIRRYTRNGSIINFHDSIKSNVRMLETVSQAIDWLQSQGYSFDTLKEHNE